LKYSFFTQNLLYFQPHTSRGASDYIKCSFIVNRIQEIIEIKGNDLNAVDDEAAFNIIAGTARSMGLEVE
jgi:large subunit ribosomal protein L11